MKFNNSLNSVYLAAIFSLASFNLMALPLQLSDEPLFINQSVPPALAVTFDDSGSMSWSWMPDSRSFSRSRPSFASSDYNLIYYNPDIEYPPPVNADGTSLPDSVFNNAKRDGYAPSGMISNKNLTHQYRVFRYYYPYYSNNNYSISYASAGRSNRENRAFYYRWIGPANATLSEKRNQNWNYQLVEITAPDEMQNFANWYSYYNTRSKLARAAVSHAFVNFGPDFKVDWQQINNNKFENKAVNMKVFADGHRQDFYDWLFNVPGSGSTPLRRSTRYAGKLFQKGGTSGPYYDQNYGGELTCQQNFHIAVSDGSWNSSAGLTWNVDNSSRTLPAFTDGTTATYKPANRFYSDNNSSTLADTSFYYWSRDLRSDLDNNVPTFIDDYTDPNGDIVNVPVDKNWWNVPELLWNPKNNPANWQHMVNFNVGLGIEGSFDRNTDLPALRRGALQWPSTYNDTCFKRDGLGNEVVRSCANHICYDGNDIDTNVVECNGEIAPVGDIQLCWDADKDKSISCTDRVVRRVNYSQGRVDDVWHASLNSRGDYFSAKNPQELSEALYAVVSNIIKRKGRASAGSISSSIISESSLTYRTGYDSSDWSGFVVAAPLNSDGTVGEVVWDAGCKLTGGFCSSMNKVVIASNNHGSRNIFTYYKNPTNGGGTQHEFHTVSMNSSEEAAMLNSTYYQNAVARGIEITLDDIVRYVRGDRNLEISFGGQYRARRSLLADVIHSPAKVIRGPGGSYNDLIWAEGSPERYAVDSGNGYTEFKDTYRDRDSVVLVGANDGMLHAFSSGLNTNNGGHEYWAYIPSKALDGISELANPQYKHKSFVDAAPYVQDAFINGSWNTVALGGMRKGGKLFYALNLGSEPKNEPQVMWEFTDDDDADMGYSYAGGIITRVQNKEASISESKWVAILPNGYNSANQKSVMYAIDLETGEMLHKWNTNVGGSSTPNGMGPPVAADFVAYDTLDSSISYYGADQASDFIYAGDLAGNIYRFDLQDLFGASVVSEPDVLYDGDYDQAITISPRIFTPSDGSNNVIVVVGTGKYIELPDRGIVGTSPQYLLGLKDSKDIAATYTLNDSRIINQDFSVTSSGRKGSTDNVETDQSWKVELPELGERIVNSIGRNNNAKLFTVASIIPNGSDPCLPGGESWIMVLDARTGGTPRLGSLFQDGTIDGEFIDALVLGFNDLTLPGGKTSFLALDGSGANGGDSNIDPIEISQKSAWLRRSWHRIIFD